MIETTVKRPRGTWPRRILIFLIGAMLLLLLVRSGLDLWAGRRLNSAVVRVEQRHGSLDVPASNAPSVPPGENRARALRAAAALLAGRYEVQRSLSDFQKLRGPAAVPPDLRAFVKANDAALRVADDARSRHKSNWEADYPTNNNTPSWMDLRGLSDAIYVEGRLDLEAGRADEAAGRIATGLALSASVSGEPNLIAQLMRISLATRHFEAVQRLLVQSEPSKASLDELAKRLDENRAPDPVHLGLLSEMKHFHRVLEREENGIGLEDPNDRSIFGRFTWFARPLSRLFHARYLEQLGHLLEEQTGPRPRPASSAAPGSTSLLKRLDGIVGLEGLHRTMDSGDTFTSQLGLTELAVALRRFRFDHGEYPGALAALVPAYVAVVPIDPLTGKPIVYVREGAGFRLRAEKGRDAWTAHMFEWRVPK